MTERTIESDFRTLTDDEQDALRDRLKRDKDDGDEEVSGGPDYAPPLE